MILSVREMEKPLVAFGKTRQKQVMSQISFKLKQKPERTQEAKYTIPKVDLKQLKSRSPPTRSKDGSYKMYLSSERKDNLMKTLDRPKGTAGVFAKGMATNKSSELNLNLKGEQKKRYDMALHAYSLDTDRESKRFKTVVNSARTSNLSSPRQASVLVSDNYIKKIGMRLKSIDAKETRVKRNIIKMDSQERRLLRIIAKARVMNKNRE